MGAEQSAAVYPQAEGLRRRRLQELEQAGVKYAAEGSLEAAEAHANPNLADEADEAKFAAQRATAQAVFDELAKERGGFEHVDATIAGVSEDVPECHNMGLYEDLCDSTLHLKPGDHIVRGGAFGVSQAGHHGVYLGKGYVVDVGGGPVNAGGIASACGLREKAAKAAIQLYRLTEFSQGKPLTLRIYQSRRRSRRETVALAVSAIGLHDYHIAKSNCEHFATFITSGHWQSAQVDWVNRTLVRPVTSTISLLNPLRYLGSAVKAVRQLVYGTQEGGCTLDFSDAGACLVDRDHRPGTRSIVCGGIQRCVIVSNYADKLKQQRQRGEPYHDPETGSLLDTTFVNVIRMLARRRQR